MFSICTWKDMYYRYVVVPIRSREDTDYRHVVWT